MDAQFVKRDRHLPFSIGMVSVDSGVLDRSSRPIRHLQCDRMIENCEGRPREFQIMLRYVLGGIREEDLIVLLHFLLASPYGKRHKVEAYGPEVLAGRRFVVDGCDKEIIKFPVESSERIRFFLSEHPCLLNGIQREYLPIEAEFGDFVGVIQCSGAGRPRTGVLIIVGSIAMMSSSGARGDPVAASGDIAFENRLGLALDAQINGGLFYFDS
jgi:hypothetical protein